MPKLLLVDDSPVVRRASARALYRSDLAFDRLVEARDAQEALARIEADRSIALVLADLSPRDGDGLELVRAIRARRARGDLAVVVVASAGAREEARRALDAGADAWVERPFTPESIGADLEEWLGRR